MLEEQKEQGSFRDERPGMDAWAGGKEERECRAMDGMNNLPYNSHQAL